MLLFLLRKIQLLDYSIDFQWDSIITRLLVYDNDYQFISERLKFAKRPIIDISSSDSTVEGRCFLNFQKSKYSLIST